MKIDDNGVVRNMTAEEQAKLQASRELADAKPKIDVEELAMNVNDALEAVMLLSLE